MGEQAPSPLPIGASFSTDVAVRVTYVALRFGIVVRFSFAGSESGMILSVPSRFGGKAMVETGIGYFGDERLKKNGDLIVQRVAERQAVCVRKLADDRPE